jgi:hypothetical protein
MAFRNRAELDAFTAWGERQREAMAHHVRTASLFAGDIVAKAVWTLPHRIFLGRVWPKGEALRGYWVITGELVPTDHIEASLAENAREAARHFALKWQLQSARMAELAEAPADAVQRSGTVEWRAVADRLRVQAEGLYAIASDPEPWKPTAGSLIEEPGDGAT